MSDRMTSITLAGTSGLGEWGRRTPAEMIAKYRKYAEYRLREAEAILAAPDDAFRVCTYVGVHVRRSLEVLQGGSDA